MINTTELNSKFLNEVKMKGKRPLDEFQVLLDQLNQIKEGTEISSQLLYEDVSKELVILTNKQKRDVLYLMLEEVISNEKMYGVVLENDFVVEFYLGVIKTLVGNQPINVANISSGAGNLITKMSSELLVNEAYSYELMESLVSIQRKMVKLTGLNVDVTQKNVITEDIPELMVDLSVLLPPFRKKMDIEDYDSKQSCLLKGLKRVREAELVYIEQAFKITKPGGYLVTILPIGLLNKVTAQPVRDSILEQAYIKAIINMPNPTFTNTGLATSMLVIQKKCETTHEPKDVIMADLSTIRLERKNKKHPTEIDEYNEVLQLLSQREGK